MFLNKLTMPKLNAQIKALYRSLTTFGKVGFWISLITPLILGIASGEPFYVVIGMTISFVVFLPAFFYGNIWLWNQIRGKTVAKAQMINLAYMIIGVLFPLPSICLLILVWIFRKLGVSSPLIHRAVKKVSIGWLSAWCVAGFVMLVGAFYWFALLPSQIRKECAWTHIQVPSTPAVPPDDSVVVPNISNTRITTIEELNASFEAEMLRKKRWGTPAIPGEDYWREATNNEYEQCLRSSGLNSKVEL